MAFSRQSALPDVLDEHRVMEAVENNTFGMGNTGFCIECGEEREGCEPDAREYECYACGENTVYGAEEILFRWGW